METNIIKMETQKVVFKMMDDEVIAIFPNNLYSEILYGNTMVDSYMHVGQHSACAVELIDELEDASEEQYKDLKIELEEIGYNLDVEKMKQYYKKENQYQMIICKEAVNEYGWKPKYYIVSKYDERNVVVIPIESFDEWEKTNLNHKKGFNRYEEIITLNNEFETIKN